MSENHPFDTLVDLENIIRARKEAGNSEKSYVASCFQKGLPTLTKKVGEEATEVIIAAFAESVEDVEAESADLLFHLMMLLEAKGTSLQNVSNVLAGRMGLSGIEEKQNRSS